MTQLPLGSQILFIASSNEGKLRENSRILAPLTAHGVLLIRADSLEPHQRGSDTPEQHFDYQLNADEKTVAGARASQQTTLAGDSGIEIDALPGELGPRSKRWYPGTERGRAEFLLQRLLQVDATTEDKRGATFITAISVATPDGTIIFRHQASMRVTTGLPYAIIIS